MSSVTQRPAQTKNERNITAERAKSRMLREASIEISSHVQTLADIYGDGTPVQLAGQLLGWINGKAKECQTY